MRDLEGKTAVVTGAASGMGFAFAEAFGRVGMNVVMADVEQDALRRAAAEIEAVGATVLPVPTDVSSEVEMLNLAEATRDAFDAAHVVCLNAGVAGGGGPMENISTKAWKWTLGVNLYGIVHGIQAFLPGLKARDEGHLVVTASVAGLTSYPNMGPYNASKHAAVTIAETLFAELAEQGSNVGVTCLCPGIVATRIAESHRNRPKELADDQDDALPMNDPAALEAAKAMFAQAKPPAEVAELVLAAVLEKRFWVQTDGAFRARIRARHQAIETDTDPPATGTIMTAYV